MKKRDAIATILGLLLAVATATVVLIRHGERFFSARASAHQEYDYLPIGDEGVVGEWNRVDFPEAVIPIIWRRFSQPGKMVVCYGDVVIFGTYKVSNEQELEIRHDHDGELSRWQFSFEDDKLVMTNLATGWVEKYRRVKPGTIDPRIEFDN